MKRTRQAIAVALVATALCADRVVGAAPRVQPQAASMAASMAGRLVERLSGSLRRTVAAVRLVQARRDGPAVCGGAALAGIALGGSAAPRIHASILSPIQFRLPPPLV